MTDRVINLAATVRRGSLFIALLLLAILLPVWLLVVQGWRTGQIAVGVVEALGVIGLVAFASAIYIAVEGARHLAEARQRQTEHAARETELRAREARSRSLLNVIPDMMFRLSVDGTFLDYHADETDMALPPEAVIGGNIRQLPAPQGVVELMLGKIQAALATGETQTLEYALHTAGGLKDFEARMVADGPGEVVAIVRDISERKRAEQSLHRWAHIFEHADWGVAIGSADGRTLELMNPAYAMMHGYTVEDLAGLPIASVYAPGTEGELRDLIQRTNETGHAVMESKHVRRDGSIFPVMVDLTAVKDGNGQLLYRVANVQDITERKQAEEALHERELQYRNVFESSLDGLFINDLNGQLVDFNPAAAHLHGYTVEEFRQLQPAQFVHPDSLHLFAAFMEAVKADQEYHCRAVDVRNDGSTFHIEVRGTPFTLRGQPHALAIVRDISAQVEAEQLLEQRVTERTRELSTLLDVSRNVASTLELEPLLGLILDALKVFVDYSSARINTLEGQVLRVRAARGRSRVDRAIGTEFQLNGLVAEEVLIHRRVLVIPDLASHDDPWAATFRSEGSANIDAILAHIQSWMGVPLIARGRVIGNLSLEHEQPGFYDAHHAEVVLALADQVAVALENARLFAEAQGKAVLEERQRLARDLHDSVTQSLYSLTLLAEASRRLIDVDMPQAARYLGDMGEIAQQSLKEMRLLVYQLRPLALEHEGLIGALQARLDSVEKRAGVEARFLIEGNLGDLPPALEEGLFRVAQEALNNALKHAAARLVAVRLRGDDDCVTLEVADDGRGSALLADDVKGGLGLTSMRERVAQLQGTLTIESAPGRGTRVTVEVPRTSLVTA